MMKATIKKRIRTLSVLLLICSFIFSTGCSTLRDWWGYDVTSSRLSNNGHAISDLNQFYSSVKPVNGTAESDYLLARYFQKRGKHKFAVDELLNALRKDPSFLKAYNALGVSFDHLGQFDLAAKSYKFALQLNPDLDYVYNNLGYSYLLKGDLDGAIDAFQKAIALDDANKRYHNNLGLAYARKGQTDMAFDEFKLAGDESGTQTKTEKLFKVQNPAVDQRDAAVETLPEGIIPYDNIPKDAAEPLLLAGSAQLISEDNSEDNKEYRLIPDGEFWEIDLSKKSDNNIVKNSAPNSTVKDMDKTEDHVSYTVQVSASWNLTDSALLMEKLIKNGYPCLYLNKVRNEKSFYRVRLGSFLDKKEADRWIPDLTNTLGYQPFIAFEDEHAEKLVSEKQNCFNATVIAHSVTKPLNIEISNGNGVRHMAKNVGIYLNPKGFRTTRLTNADHFNYPETKIYYKKGHRQDALRLAEEIPGRQENANVVEHNMIKRRVIKVLIGKDIVPFNDRILGSLKSNSTIIKADIKKADRSG